MRSHEARRLRRLYPSLAPAIVANIPLDAYQRRQLPRVRQQLDKLHQLFDALLNAKEIDTTAIEKMSRSIATFSDLERVLSCRPLPGTNRPSASNKQQVSMAAVPLVSVAPIAPEPEPLAISATP